MLTLTSLLQPWEMEKPILPGKIPTNAPKISCLK